MNSSHDRTRSQLDVRCLGRLRTKADCPPSKPYVQPHLTKRGGRDLTYQASAHDPPFGDNICALLLDVSLLATSHLHPTSITISSNKRRNHRIQGAKAAVLRLRPVFPRASDHPSSVSNATCTCSSAPQQQQPLLVLLLACARGDSQPSFCA